jgi:hypothetical protein
LKHGRAQHRLHRTRPTVQHAGELAGFAEEVEAEVQAEHVCKRVDGHPRRRVLGNLEPQEGARVVEQAHAAAGAALEVEDGEVKRDGAKEEGADGDGVRFAAAPRVRRGVRVGQRVDEQAVGGGDGDVDGAGEAHEHDARHRPRLPARVVRPDKGERGDQQGAVAAGGAARVGGGGAGFHVGRRRRRPGQQRPLDRAVGRGVQGAVGLGDGEGEGEEEADEGGGGDRGRGAREKGAGTPRRVGQRRGPGQRPEPGLVTGARLQGSDRGADGPAGGGRRVRGRVGRAAVGRSGGDSVQYSQRHCPRCS